MKNLLSLHEAIAIVLLNKPKRTASFDKIASEIEPRGLYKNRKGGVSLAEQVRLRSTLAGKRYAHLFEEIKPGYIRLT